MDKRINKNQRGFSLVEVMIALAIFSVFVTSLILTQSTNVNNSILMAEDLNLHNLAIMKMNETLIAEKEFTNATEKDPETGKFKGDDFKLYKFKIEYQKTEFPDFSQLMGQEEDEYSDKKDDSIRKKIFDKLKKNVEEMIWQVKVTVTNTETDYKYELSSWITNPKAKIDLNFAL
jgi:prepilin-type N-terminal cleavage/methylation domain-containing protein